MVGAFALLLSLGGLLVGRLRRPKLDVIRLFSPPVVVRRIGRARLPAAAQRRLGHHPRLLWNDAIPWREAQAPQLLAPIRIGSVARRTAVIDYEVHPPRRGLFPIGPLVVEYSDPFGMVRSLTAVGSADRLTVVPAVVDLPDGGPVLIDGDGSAQLVQRRAVGNDDDLSTREYRWGDALRRVHWRASARHGELMVRQEEHRSHPDARIIIDTRLGGYPDAEPDSVGWPPSPHSAAFEWVVRMLASLAVHLDASRVPGRHRRVRRRRRWSTSASAGRAGSASSRSSRASPRCACSTGAARGSCPRRARMRRAPRSLCCRNPTTRSSTGCCGSVAPDRPGRCSRSACAQAARERFVDAGWLCVDVAAGRRPRRRLAFLVDGGGVHPWRSLTSDGCSGRPPPHPRIPVRRPPRGGPPCTGVASPSCSRRSPTALAGLHVLLQGVSWWIVGVGYAAAVLLIAAAARSLLRSLVWPPVISFVAGIMLLTARLRARHGDPRGHPDAQHPAAPLRDRRIRHRLDRRAEGARHARARAS